MLGSWQGVNGRKKVENPWLISYDIRFHWRIAKQNTVEETTLAMIYDAKDCGKEGT